MCEKKIEVTDEMVQSAIDQALEENIIDFDFPENMLTDAFRLILEAALSEINNQT